MTASQTPDLPEPDPVPKPPRKGVSRFAGVALLITLSVVILRTTLSSGSTDYKQVSLDANAYIEATIETKVAYVNPTKTKPNPALSGLTKHKPKHHSESTPEDKAIQKWEKLAESSSSRRAWERLGIVRFLFGKPGGMNAFLHILSKSQATVPKHSKSAFRSLIQASRDPDPMAPAQEVALWQTLYGTAPIPQAQVPKIRNELAQLKLGWFESFAVAHLYRRIGATAKAQQEEDHARQSALLLEHAQEVQAWLLLTGTMGLLVYGFRAFARKITSLFPDTPRPSAIDFKADFDIPPISGSPMTGIAPTQPKAVLDKSTDIPLSYDTRILAFVGYLLISLVIGLPLALIAPQTKSWSSAALIRFDILAEILLMVPTAILPLLLLRFLAARDTVPPHRPSWRALLATLGFRSSNIAGDIAAGIRQYIVFFPLVTLMGVLSEILFHKYHTPINPVDLLLLGAQSPVDKIMLLLLASVVAPVMEELFFRGLLFGALRKPWGIPGGIVLSAAMFAVLHNTLPGGFLPIWMLGVAFAMLNQERRSLLPGIVMHGLHNGFLLVIMFVTISN